MLILFFKAQQFGLFETEVPIAGHVTKRGTVVAPYRAKRKKRPEEANEEDLFAEKQTPIPVNEPVKEEKPKGEEAHEIDTKRVKRIAERFGLTEKEVADALSTPPDELVARNEHAPNNKMDTPAEFKRYPIGSAQIDEYGDMENRYINFLREFDPKDLTITEAEEGIRKTPIYQKYVQWAKEGKEPPYVFVAQTDKGTLQVTNRRRTMAAKEAGKKLKGWFGPANQETGNPLKYGDLKRAYSDKDEKSDTPLKKTYFLSSHRYLFLKAS